MEQEAGAAIGAGGGRQRTAAVYVPPLNFAMVSPGIYRSGYPVPCNFPFLRKLGLKSIVHLGPDEYLPANSAFAADQGVTVFHAPLRGNKEPFVSISNEELQAALLPLLEPDNFPLLIHCNKGKSRTGCVVGCYRKLQNWSISAIFEEYNRHAGDGSTSLTDQQYIELFDPRSLPRIRISHADTAR
jgi:tyrosine-protein phosphatase SIW14